MAKEVWDRSSIPLPLVGFSRSSVFLNIHYLFSCSKKNSLDPKLRLAFPWVLWYIWKNRNMFCFEKRRIEPAITLDKALEEAAVWLRLNSFIPNDVTEITCEETNSNMWTKPPLGVVNCNVGSAWSSSNGHGGMAWIVRDSYGNRPVPSIRHIKHLL